MGQISIAIRKKVGFRDSVQHFSNVYTYGSADSNPIFGTGAILIDEVVQFERAFHSSEVFFVEGMMWSSGGTKAENKLILRKPLNLQGNAATNFNMDRERTVLVQWPAGKDTRNKPVYLRKWYHACGSFGSVSFSAGQLQNTESLSTAQRSSIVDLTKSLSRIGGLQEWGLIADSGRERDGGDPIAHRYLEHHQLGDEWRQ